MTKSTQTQEAQEETLLKFPCLFPIKAMGPADSPLKTVVTEICRRHAPDLDTSVAVTTRASRNGKWLSVTVQVSATSKSQLDAIYRELTAHELVVYAL